MSKLPVISGKGLIKALTKIGYSVHDKRGSHVHLRHAERRPLTVPFHGTIARGTLRTIIKQAGLSREEFLKLLEK